MPNVDASREAGSGLPSARQRGWYLDSSSSAAPRLVAVFNGTEIFDFDGNDLTVAQAMSTVAITAATGDVNVTVGNFRAGVVSAFATTEPTSWLVCKAGTQPAGAIATSGGVGANATTVQKIIAAGTINNVET